MLPSAHRKNVDDSSAVAMVCRRLPQWIRRTLTQPQAPPNGDHGLSLPSMPPEILSAIVDLVDPENLPALRLTSKHLCAIANTPFATLHFSERRHVQSAYSMDALIEITAHPFFGRFVKSVIISGSRPQLCGNPIVNGTPGAIRTCANCHLHKRPDPNHVVLTFERLRDKLNEAFSNIRRYSTPVFVGVCDSIHTCYGSVKFGAHCREIEFKHLSLKKMWPLRRDCAELMESFQVVLQAAQESACQMQGTKLHMFGLTYKPNTPHDREIQSMLFYFLDSLSGILSFELSFQVGEYGSPSYYLKYDHVTGGLDISGVNFVSYPLDDDYVNMRIVSMLNRLSAQPISYVRLRDSICHMSDFFRVFCYPTLAKFTMHDVTLDTDNFDCNLWSSLLSQLARTTNLKYLELSECQYEIDWERNEVADPDETEAWFRTPNGLYQFHPEIHDIKKFYPAPSGDITKKMILSDRTSISIQLQEFADQVAQLEVDKIARIEKEEFVRHDIVGICKDLRFKSYEYYTSDDDEDVEDAQDGESGDESDTQDELAENDSDGELGNTL
jgi:hypothetical protein